MFSLVPLGRIFTSSVVSLRPRRVYLHLFFQFVPASEIFQSSHSALMNTDFFSPLFKRVSILWPRPQTPSDWPRINVCLRSASFLSLFFMVKNHTSVHHTHTLKQSKRKRVGRVGGAQYLRGSATFLSSRSERTPSSCGGSDVETSSTPPDPRC